MGRLTEKASIGAYEYYTARNSNTWRCVQKLAHYEDLEEQGKLVERMYGYWSLHIDETFDCEYLTCSICGEDFFDGDNDTVDYVPNYCPNCGAKMVVTEAKLNDLNS